MTKSSLGGTLCLAAGLLWLVMGATGETHSVWRITVGAALVVFGLVLTSAARRARRNADEEAVVDPQDDVRQDDTPPQN